LKGKEFITDPEEAATSQHKVASKRISSISHRQSHQVRDHLRVKAYKFAMNSMFGEASIELIDLRLRDSKSATTKA
jgi:hypothetical protein